jgi:hypothetical protein
MTLKVTTLGLAAAIAAAFPSAVAAQPVSLLGDGYFGQGAALVPASHQMPVAADRAPLVAMDRSPFIAVRQEAPDIAVARTGASLFAGQASGGLFTPHRSLAELRGSLSDLGGTATALALGPDATAIERLRHLIGQAESHADGYDAINYGAKRLPDRRPTELTLGEIYAWIAATPGQPHAIGRFQFIPRTLKRLARQIGAEEHERFSPELQDRLADELFAEAGLAAYRDGLMSQTQFMNNLAKIWAGLPNSSGRSHYHGYAGNAATMTWANFEAEMTRIFQG